MADALLLLGPTGSGKSALALELARHQPLEIISVDSAQVYRGLDIGSAKPTLEERAAVPHHLIDIRDPTAALLGRRIRARRAGCHRRRPRARPAAAAGRRHDAVREGAARRALEPAVCRAAVRAALDADARRLGWPALHARLAALDPDTARRLAPNDAQRIQRALEVIEVTGKPMSALLAQPAATATAATWWP